METHRGNVLIIEDDADIRAAVSQVLGYEGYTVTEAGNGLEALELLKKSRPSLIILDLMMPVMDGYETNKVLRADPELRDIPVIVMTASTMREGNQITSAAYLRKPIKLDTLLETVDRVLH